MIPGFSSAVRTACLGSLPKLAPRFASSNAAFMAYQRASEERRELNSKGQFHGTNSFRFKVHELKVGATFPANKPFGVTTLPNAIGYATGNTASANRKNSANDSQGIPIVIQVEPVDPSVEPGIGILGSGWLSHAVGTVLKIKQVHAVKADGTLVPYEPPKSEEKKEEVKPSFLSRIFGL